MGARVILYTRHGCQLCNDARPLLASALGEAGVNWDEVDVDEDPVVANAYGELVPAVTVDGVLTGFWRSDPERVLGALR